LLGFIVDAATDENGTSSNPGYGERVARQGAVTLYGIIEGAFWNDLVKRDVVAYAVNWASEIKCR